MYLAHFADLWVGLGPGGVPGRIECLVLLRQRDVIGRLPTLDSPAVVLERRLPRLVGPLRVIQVLLPHLSPRAVGVSAPATGVGVGVGGRGGSG